ncbi:Ubiquitin-conjugating enzyme E2 variant 3 [Plecturocebus cupreus]
MSPGFLPGRWVMVSLTPTRFWPCPRHLPTQGSRRRGYRTPGAALPEPWAWNAGGISSLGRGGALDRREVCSSAASVLQQVRKKVQGLGSWDLALGRPGDGVRLRGPETAAWQGAGSQLGQFWVLGVLEGVSAFGQFASVLRFAACSEAWSGYKFRDLTVEELKNVNLFFPHFKYSMDTYVFKDSSQKDLLNFTGTIPVMYQGNTYNIPIRFWILDSHPFAPPICFLKPTANMGISVGKHVDAQGRIYLPYLQNWSHPKSVIVGLIKEMIAKFQEELPLYSLSSSDEARQVDLLAYIAKITEGVSDINSKSWANHENKSANKITVVGGGELGIACTLAISAKGIADRLVLLDLSERTKGGMMDLEIFNLPNVEISKGLVIQLKDVCLISSYF